MTSASVPTFSSPSSWSATPADPLGEGSLALWPPAALSLSGRWDPSLPLTASSLPVTALNDNAATERRPSAFFGDPSEDEMAEAATAVLVRGGRPGNRGEPRRRRDPREQATDSTPSSFVPGAWLRDTYRVERRLARGGMGEVFAATHARLPGLFAIKVLQPEFADDLEICTRFRREAEVMATLHHPHIVQVADYDTSPEGRPYLVMEHLDGPDLGMVMRRQGPLPCALVASLVAQMAAALAAAHARGIVHLDLKPENVVVLGLDEGTPFVKIIDFGIAKSATSEKEPEGTIIGTPEYMSPEQIEGHLDRIDGRSDQFSLATMAFVMLTGHSPWGMEEPFALLHRIGHERAQSLANYLSLPMPHVEAVLQRALAKAPEARYATITAFAEALEDAINRDGAGRSRFSRFGEEDTFRSFG